MKSFPKQLLSLVGFLILQGNCLGALSILDTAINPANGHTYYLLENSNWTDAENQAVALGGHLVTINDAAENDWVWSRWGGGRSLWIGLNDAANEGTFVWASGEPVTFINWRAGEPNDGNLGEDYGYFYSGGLDLDRQWNDYQDSNIIYPEPLLYGVVEVVEEAPCALAMDELIALVNDSSLSQRRKRPLLATLEAARASFADGAPEAATNQLQAFQNKVHAQVRGLDATLGETLIAAAQSIIYLGCSD